MPVMKLSSLEGSTTENCIPEFSGQDAPPSKSMLPILEPSAAAKSLQFCPTLCDPIDSSLPGSLSLGFSRQEKCSGLPFPSILAPMLSQMY